MSEPKKTAFIYNENLDTVYLNEAYGNDPTFALEMFQMFLEIIDEELLIIRGALDINSLDGFKQKLHRIKPTFGMVGLKSISDRIETLRKQIDAQENIDLQKWYDQLEKDIVMHTAILEIEVENLKQFLAK